MERISDRTRAIAAAILLVIFLIAQHTGLLQLCGINIDEQSRLWLALYLIPYLIAGCETLKEAFENIIHKELFGEEFLMVIATIGAFAVGEYAEAVTVMILFMVGEMLEELAEERSRRSVEDLMSITPEYANILKDGQIVVTAPSDVPIGAVAVIKPGERIPLDGVVIEGTSDIDTSALTGESMPVSVGPDAQVYSGSVNLSGKLSVRITKEYSDSTVARILELVENAAEQKGNTEKFITKFAKVYTPCVTIIALLMAIIMPIATGTDVWTWIKRACTFLVISCPCALVISVPLGFFGGIGGMAKRGILVKGSNYIEALSKLSILMTDKTGTITKGQFAVSDIAAADGVSEKVILRLAAAAESYSTHPIAECIVREYEKNGADSNAIGQASVGVSAIESSEVHVSDVNEEAGYGISAGIDGKRLLVGNIKLMIREKVSDMPDEGDKQSATKVYVAYDGKYMGCVTLQDMIKDNAADSFDSLRARGVRQIIMLTGDTKDAAQAVAMKVGIREQDICAQLLPADKVAKAGAIIDGKSRDDVVGFIGDGINDAPVLMRADVGIAMGALGSDAAIEAADVVIMDDDLSKISEAVGASRRTIGIVKENIIFALAVKAIVLILGAVGLAAMWAAVFADVGVSLIAILNSSRTGKA